MALMMLARIWSAIPRYTAMTNDTLRTTEVERRVASLVGHWTRLNSVLTSSKNCRARLNIKPLSSQTHRWETGRTDRDRTCDLRFWRPMLYQLSYCPVRTAKNPPILLSFFVHGMFTFPTTKLTNFHAFCFEFFIPRCRVVSSFALWTFQLNCLSHS